MFTVASPRESRRGLLAATYPLVFASPELQVSASVFLNSSFSSLGHSLYGSRPGTKPGTKKDLSSVSSVTALVDSGADVHILSYEDALKMLLDVRPSTLRVVGVNGSSSRAACQGSRFVQVQAPSGTFHRVDLGTAHGMRSCPANLLSLSQLVDVGSVLHFEKGDCCFHPPPRFQSQGKSRERIPLNRVGGLYEIALHKLALDAESTQVDYDTTFKTHVDSKFARENWDPTDFNESQFHSCAVQGISYLSGSLDLWHRRMRQVSKEQLKRIHAHGLVDGFNVVGNAEVRCQCDTCAMAKIRAHASKKQSKFPNAPKRIGEHVSSDVRSVPYD